jgi:hypothetical protein
MSEFVEFESVAESGSNPAVWACDSGRPSPDAALIAACSAARAAAQAFDDAARRGAPFGALCDLSIDEQKAVKAVAVVRSSTPQGIAEKALLLQFYFGAAGRSSVTEDTFNVAVSLAADALALAKGMIPKAPAQAKLAAK